ncbi:MAG: nodulation protein NfeD [Bdellovibrionales bacterium]|nr:nodulation protein NfeD [Bdellovibrionales bacterium]
MKLYLLSLLLPLAFSISHPISHFIANPLDLTSQENFQPGELKKKLIQKILEKMQADQLDKKADQPNKKQANQPDKKTNQQKNNQQEGKQNKEKLLQTDKTKNKTLTPSSHKKASEPTPVKNTLIKPTCTIELKIEGFIGAATLDILDRAIYEVKKQKCSSLLLLINTPGGQLLSTRKIVDRILNTDFPVLCLIYPAGAHAGSAGAIIMQACHVNGGIETTNIGAATPILGGGQKMSEDLRKKMINDTTSWLDSLTQLRKRSQKFGREIVTEAKALSAKEAAKEKALDFAGKTKLEFLQFAEGRTVTVKDGKNHVVQVGGDIIPVRLGFRHHFVSFITEPEIIYILFTGSLFLLYYEITHPGLGAPGILGAMGLILAFMGMHKLDFSWAGLILILLSMALFLAEVFISGFGIFGASAIISFVIGSFLLFDPAKTGGVDISISLIISVTIVFALLMGMVTWLAVSTLRMRKKTNISDDFMDKDSTPAEVMHVNEDGLSGLAFIKGENWHFQCKTSVKKGDKVKVLQYKNLILEVESLK